jgi:hypothetical protein
LSKIEQLRNTPNNLEKIEMTLNAIKITLNRQTIILENILEELRSIKLGMTKKARKKN